MKTPNDKLELPAAMLAKLDAVGRLERRTSLWTGLLRGITILLAAMLVAMAIDWWIVLFDVRWRWALSLSALACAAAGLGLGLLRPLFQRRSLTSLARQVDEKHPVLEERFQTVAELAQSEDAPALRGSEALLRKVAEQATALSEAVTPESIVPRTSLLNARRSLAAVGGVLLLLFLVDFSRMKILSQRFWAPGADVTLTQVHALTGDPTIGKGESVTLEIATSGKRCDAATLLLRSAGGKTENVALKRTAKADSKFVFAKNAVAESFEYRVRCSDGQTTWHRVSIAERPTLARVALRVIPPAYSRLPVGEAQSLPHKFRALEASRLEASFQADQPLASMELRFSDGKTIALAESSDHIYHFTTVLTNSLTFAPVLTNLHRLENSAKPACEIAVYRDEPPAVKVVSPTDEITARPDDVVKIDFEARDDFGIAEAKLLVTIKTETNVSTVTIPIPLDQTPGAKLVRQQIDLDLKQFHLKQDEELTYAVQVTDTKQNLSRATPSAAEAKPSLAAKSENTQTGERPSPSTNSPAASSNTRNGSAAKQSSPSRLASNTKPSDQPPPPSDQSGTPPPPNNMAMRMLDVGQSSTCQPRKILVDEWGRSFEGQVREKLEIAIDPVLKLLEELFGKARKQTDASLATARSAAGLSTEQQTPLETAKGHLRQADSAVTELKSKCQDTPYAFIGLQLHDIRDTYISPARQHLANLAFESSKAKDDVAHLEQASFLIQQAEEKLRELTRSYAAVKRDYKLADAMQRLKKMHQLFLEDTQAMLGSKKPALNSVERKTAEVDDAFVEKLRQLLEAKKKIMAELAKILAEDPRLLRRYLALEELEGTSLRDQMTLLAQRQESLAKDVAQWASADPADRAPLLRQVLVSQSAEQTEVASLAAKLHENFITWLPLDVLPDSASIGECRTLVADTARMASEAAERASSETKEGVASANKTLEQLRVLNERLPLLEPIPFASNLKLKQFTANRLDEVAVLITRQSGWIKKMEALQAGDLPQAAEVDQHRLAVDTQELSEKLDSNAVRLGQLSPEIADKAEQLTGTVHDQVLKEQTSATDALSKKTVPAAAHHQTQATTGFAAAEKQFDEWLRLIVAKLDQAPPPTNPGQAPNLEDLLTMLQEEAKACESLGIPCRPINVSVMKDWLKPGSCSNPGQALAQAQSAQMQSRLAMEKTQRASEQAKKLAQKRASELAGPQLALDGSGPKRPSRSWNTLVSQLGDELRQGRDNIPPEQYRQAIEQYFQTISERMPAPASPASQSER